ncbi:MAG: hypothetical protein HOP28_07635 [Gemmatimonadales bacterium]|nr:hypothetical protein [Gemmatimonadales bacterium]
MPATAKLSRAFYDRLGDNVANELADWLNQVDHSCRAELRELNELNFARFDARMGERMAELRADMQARFAALQIDLERRTQTLRTEIERCRSTTLRWMFAFWAPTMLAVLGLFLKR